MKSVLHEISLKHIFLLSILVLLSSLGFGEPAIKFRADHMVLDSITDGRKIYAATQNGRINRFDITSRKKESDLIRFEELPDEYPPTVYSVSLSPTKKLLASGTSTGELILFQLPENRELKRIKIKDVENITIVRFLDENRIILGLMDGSLRLIDWKKDHYLYKTKVDFSPLTSVVISPNRKWLGVTSHSSIIKIADAESGQVKKALDGHKDTIHALAFIGNSQIVSGSKDKTARLWNVATGSNSILFTSTFYINSIAWNGHKTIALHLPNYQVGVMDLTSKRIIKKIKGHTAFINTMIFLSPDKLLSSGNDARIHIHDL